MDLGWMDLVMLDMGAGLSADICGSQLWIVSA